MTYLLKWDNYSFEEKALCVFVQGILNRKNVKTFIDVDHYIDYLKDEYIEIDVFELIKKHEDLFCGIVTYNLSFDDIGINLACLLCAKYDFLAVPNNLIDKVLNITSLKVVRELKKGNESETKRQRNIFNEVKDSLNNEALVHQVVKEGNFHLTLRDFAIKNRYACIYTNESEESRLFREEILKWLKPVSPIFGWNDNEIAFIEHISSYGHYAIPSDWSSNHSYFEISSTKILQNPRRTQIKSNKHYLAIVVSDGDNIQWLERDFATSSTFGERKRSTMDYKMTWTISPSLSIYAPEAIKYIYNTAKLDYFIASVSGIGYANILSFPSKHLPKFIDESIKGMKNSNQSVVCLLDNIANFKDPNHVEFCLKNYSNNDNIIGGIWEIDPNRYSSGNGRIFYSNNKPFISVRYSLWCSGVTTGNVSKEFLDEYIEKINSLKPDMNTEDGYTVLNIHPWSISMKDLDYVVSNLKDHIELVYADELIELVKRNVIKK